ncbi:hypothetical protein J6590_060319 [Homalodisca vitripennis]|nr:hypothetical protein J6590_060319 [Homalodisca vitripennis]
MSSSSPATPSATGTAVTRASATRSPAPAAEIVATRPSATRSPSHSGTPTGTLTSTVASCRPSPTLHARSPFEESSPNTTPRPGPLHCTCGLEAENMELKRRIEQLTAERDQILDHSIQAEAVEENHTFNNNTKDEGWVLVKSKPKRKSKKKKRNPNPANKSSANHHAKNTPRIDPPFSLSYISQTPPTHQPSSRCRGR